MSMIVTNISGAIAAAAAYNIQPPAGQGWLIKEFASEEPFVGNQPDLAVGIADGVLTLANVIQDPTDRADKGLRPKELYITNANYITVTNTGLNPCFVGFTGERVDPNIIITDMVTCPTGGLGYVDIQPPAGQTWRITEFGAELYDAGTDNPEVTVGIIAGALVASIMMEERCDRGWNKLFDWIIDNTTYLRITNSAAADVDVAYCGTLWPYASVGAITDVVGSATLDIQPPAGQEWVITEFAGELWSGVPGAADVPLFDVSLYDGTNLSDVLEPLASAGWNRRLLLEINNDTYLRVTETGAGANNEFAYLGYLKRSYS